MSAKPRVAVIGAGIIGASIAYHLSRRGCAVTVVEANPRAAMGVTAHAFGWINLIHGQPDRPAAYTLLREAVEEYARLEQELPMALQSARRGSLVWEDQAEATEALVAAHRAQGTAVNLVDGATVARFEPHLTSPPLLAALTSALAAASRSSRPLSSTSRIASSATMLVRPSEQST